MPRSKPVVMKGDNELGDLEQTHNVLDSSAVDDQDLRLGFLIHDVSRLRRNAFDLLMRPHGITRSQWWVLAYLSRRDGTTQTELAVLLDIGKVALGGIIDRLEVAKFIERRPDPVDRRAKRIFLTRSAQALLRKMRVAEPTLNQNVLKGLSREERTQLAGLMTRIKHNLNDLVGRPRG